MYKVCYICEGLALSAVRFITAVELASRVSELFSSMNQGQLMDVMQYILAPHNIPKNNAVCSKALELERSLRSSPRFELRRTDTLVVPSSPQPRQVIQPETMIPTVIPPLSSVIQVPVAPPAPAPVAPPTSMFSLRKQTEVAVDPNLNVVRVINKDTKQIILHPMVTGSDGNIYVPSLQVQLLDNGILKSAPNIQNVLPTPSPPPPQTDSTLRNIPEQNAFEPRKTGKNKEKSDYYNFLVSQMEQKQSQNAYVEIIKMNDMNIVLEGDGTSKKRRKRSEGDIEKTLSDVQLLLNENAQGGCEIKYEIIDDDDDGKDGKEPATTGPLEKADRTVDWEDKIPMDVISFVDATDPNPEERIMQPPPMGVISDVRTVPSEPIECIDLC